MKTVSQLEAEIKQLQKQLAGYDPGLIAMINEAKDELIVARWLEVGILPVGTRVRTTTDLLTPKANGVVTGDNNEENWLGFLPLDGSPLHYINRHYIEFAIGSQWYNAKGEKI